MSEASRAAALQHAAAVHQGSGDPVATLKTAEAFHTFIQRSEGNANVLPATKGPPKVAAKAPAKAAKAAPPVEEAEVPEDSGVTKEEVGEAIEAMLNANLRPAAIKLFKKYGANSLSGVKPEDYAAVKQEAEDTLLNA